MADPQDRSEALDDDKLTDEYPPHEWLSGEESVGGSRPEGDLAEDLRGDPPGAAPPPLVDETADAEPSQAEVDRGAIDAGETGNWVLGEEGEPMAGGPLDGPTDRVPPPAEEQAMHVIEDEDDLQVVEEP